MKHAVIYAHPRLIEAPDARNKAAGVT